MKKIVILMAAMALALGVAQGMGAKPVLSETPDAKATVTSVPGDTPANEVVGQNGKVWEVELRDDPSAPEIKSKIIAENLGKEVYLHDVSRYGVLLCRPYGREIIVVSHEGKILARKTFKDTAEGTLFYQGGTISDDGAVYFQKYSKAKRVEIWKLDQKLEVVGKYKINDTGGGGLRVTQDGVYYNKREDEVGNDGVKRRKKYVKNGISFKNGKSGKQESRYFFGINEGLDSDGGRASVLRLDEDSLTTEGEWQVVTAYSKSGRVVGRIKFNSKLFPKSNPAYETSIESIFMDRKGRIHAVIDMSLPPGPMRKNADIIGRIKYIVMNTDGRVIAHRGGGPSMISADGVGYLSGPVSEGNFGLEKFWIDER